MSKWKKIQNPEIFQGNKQKKSYFEGWYFKNIDHKRKHIYAIIPGIALDKINNTSHSFIQFFDGKKGEYHYFKYEVDEFHASENKFEVCIGDNYFSSKYIHIDINQAGKRIKGDLKFKNLTHWKRRLLSPGIMGLLSYLPMETKHGIISMNHDIEGRVSINNEETRFLEGSKGYIEKDWGSSFPSSWIWMQSNHFSEPHLSCVFSVAKIPFLGLKFIGFFFVIWFRGKFYIFASYTQAKLRKLKIDGNRVFIKGENKDFSFIIKAVQGKATDMKAPSLGNMRGHCFESMKSKIELRLVDKKHQNVVFEDVGKYAGLEIMDNNELEK